MYTAIPADTVKYTTRQVTLYQQPKVKSRILNSNTMEAVTSKVEKQSWLIRQKPSYSKGLTAFKEHVNSINKWRYLLSDSLTFSDQTHAIRIQKPQASMVMEYCKKLLCAAQLKELFIENHEFTQTQKAELISLAKSNNVSIILLNVERGYQRNVLSGPWLQ